MIAARTISGMSWPEIVEGLGRDCPPCSDEERAAVRDFITDRLRENIADKFKEWVDRTEREILDGTGEGEPKGILNADAIE